MIERKADREYIVDEEKKGWQKRGITATEDLRNTTDRWDVLSGKEGKKRRKEKKKGEECVRARSEVVRKTIVAGNGGNWCCNGKNGGQRWVEEGEEWKSRKCVYIAERNGRTSNSKADVDRDWTTRTEARGDQKIRWHPRTAIKGISGCVIKGGRSVVHTHRLIL